MRQGKDRKSKGSLSVLEEFTSNLGAGDILFIPKATPEVLKKIEEATRLADIPISSRSTPELTSDFEFHDDDSFSPMGVLAKKIKHGGEIADSMRSPSGIETTSEALGRRETGVSSALGRRETGVSSALGRRETGVSSALGKSTYKSTGVSSALDKPLDNREIGVRQIENSALEIEQIVGKEKALLLIIHDECKRLGELETNFIGTDSLKKLLSLDSLGLRNLIFRVKEKGFFEVTSKQLGRVGLRKFKISRTIYQQFLNSALVSRETGVSSALGKPLDKPLETAPYSSSINTSLNITTTELPENLRRFGISAVNLQALVASGKTTQEVIERSLAALSFDVDHGKRGNFANILFGVLGSGREYVSQKYSEALQKELDDELNRLQQTEENQKKAAEIKLQAQFKEFLISNPDFLNSVQERHNAYVKSRDILEMVAFEEFKALNLT